MKGRLSGNALFCINILIFKVLSIENINTKVNNQGGSDKKGQL